MYGYLHQSNNTMSQYQKCIALYASNWSPFVQLSIVTKPRFVVSYVINHMFCWRNSFIWVSCKWGIVYRHANTSNCVIVKRISGAWYIIGRAGYRPYSYLCIKCVLLSMVLILYLCFNNMYHSTCVYTLYNVRMCCGILYSNMFSSRDWKLNTVLVNY